ncbi:MAG: hypothetical protein NC180_08315 [Muribaculaceae bacterium]|nr:cyclic nucleotide-binding domain-containing protein [Roseburia sp.]MCM1431496.1 hypothetical protein [Muribaculaceae bacterium]MCM1493210.1 hypothetical protein [Muribaculaceae bacterium]
MNVIKVKAGETVAKRQDKVMGWYLIQEGSVVRQFEFAESVMSRNSIIGIMESEWFSCDYVAREDSSLIVIPCKNAADLQNILRQHENFRPIFLRTAVEQRHQLLCLYAALQRKTKTLHSMAESLYNDYKAQCGESLLTVQPFPRIESFKALHMMHKAEAWEIANSNSLVKNYLTDFMQLMVKDDGLCVGAIMEASAQMRRVTLGIGEMVHYLLADRDILYADSGDDIFHLYFDMAGQLSRKNQDISVAQGKMRKILEVMEELGTYTQDQLKECRSICENYNFDDSSRERVDITREDCVSYILDYAGYEKDAVRKFKSTLEAFRELPDPQSTEDAARRLRREIAVVFYDVYEKAFLRSMGEEGRPEPVLAMFFNFGFMDAQLLGEENTNALYNLSDALGFFSSDHIFTIYEWLKCIYLGKKEPSRNEFDQDYLGYLTEQKRLGEITEAQMAEYRDDCTRKVVFEIQNVFQTGNRVTYGRVSTFCPVISEPDIFTAVEKMALTAERVENAINKVRQLDYSILYREVLFSDPKRGINQEWVMKEVLPDVILMPNAGSKALMWQETSGAKSDTPARFFFPILTSMDVDEQMVEVLGRYRWEICRRIQGVYWNDIREASLTSEYYDYVQFYRKNGELSADAKEKLKLALSRARNNYREVFVKDYQNWMKYESQGSFRLNKVARAIFLRYCPFPREVRQGLISNPVYAAAFMKLEAENKKKVQRLTALYDKYQAVGGTLTPDLKENLSFYQM